MNKANWIISNHFTEKAKISQSLIFALFFLLINGLSACKSTAQSIKKDSTNTTKDSLIPNADYTLIKEIKIEANLLATDKLQNIYIATIENELIKYDSKGNELYRYSNFDLGEISHIDASNPFNILLYYEDYQTIEILDRTLTKTAEFDLFNSDAPTVRAVAMSNDQYIWIYDEVNFKLKKLNTSGDIIFESANLSIIFENDYIPTFVAELGENVYLVAPNKSVYVFDVFGNYINNEPFSIPSAKLQLLQNVYVYRKEGVFYIHNPTLGGIYTSKLVMPVTKYKVVDAEIRKNQMVILEEEQLKIYTFEQN
jgi:hypothetical protein